MIQQSGTRLLDMINDVLDISRIESHKVMVQLEAFNPDELLATIRSMVLSLIESKPIKFRIQKSPSVPDTLVSDPKKLQQILINLLSNAVKFTPEGRIHLNLHYKDSQLHVEVEDSGIGIAPDAHSKIFQRFQQIDNTASKEYQGTGLGLHIVSKLLELLGGGISVESQPQTGTIMRFWVPVSSPDTHDASLQERSYSRKISWYGLDDSNKKLALIVDSNLNHQFLFTNLLREANFRFVSCYDAHHGLLLTNELLPDLLILNMEMPKVQGVPYLDRLKQTNDHLRLPILAFTSIENPHFNIQGLTLELYKGILEESRLLTAIQNLSLIENAPKICNWLYLYEHAELPKNMLPSGAACFKNEHPETARLAIERRFVQHLLLDGLSSEGPNLQLIETLILHHHRMPDLILISDDPNPLRSVSLQNLPYRQITSTDLARAGTLEAALLTLHPPKL